MSPTISTDSSRSPSFLIRRKSVRAGAAAMAMESGAIFEERKLVRGSSNFSHVVDVNGFECFKIPLASLPAI